jgi:hypothetical protein
VDIQVANKILALAAQLEKDADDIQKLNANKPAGDQVAGGKSAGNPGSGSSNSNPATGGNSNSGNSNTESTKGTVFRIQLGAFSNQPSKSGFKNLGSISVLNEDGLYKVLSPKLSYYRISV